MLDHPRIPGREMLSRLMSETSLLKIYTQVVIVQSGVEMVDQKSSPDPHGAFLWPGPETARSGSHQWLQNGIDEKIKSVFQMSLHGEPQKGEIPFVKTDE